MNTTKIISLYKTLLSSSPSSRAPSSLIRTIFQSSAEDKEEETFSELQHHIKIDGETVEVMFTADWGRGLSSKQVQEEIVKVHCGNDKDQERAEDSEWED